MNQVHITRIESTEEIIDTRAISMADLQRMLNPVDISNVDVTKAEYEYTSKVDIFNVSVKKSLR